MGPAKNSSILFLHGAGNSDRTRFTKMRELLAEQGVSSCAFDFIGHGETSGDLLSSSLQQRTEEALAVIKALALKQPLTIIAASMSGYTAIKLTELVSIDTLIFLAPAVYTPTAYALPFGQGFAETIRQTDSWQQTDAWNILQKFSGKLLIFEGENDQVVPKELIEKLYDSATQAQSREIVIVPGATHPMGKYLEEHPKDLHIVINRISKEL